MQQLPDALAPLAAYRQFILWTIIDGRKLPVNPHTLRVFVKGDGWQDDPTMWTDAATACKTAELMGDDYGVGFFFTAADPFYFVDIDKCLTPAREWSQTANDIMSRLPGAAIEVSQSGNGLHIFGQYQGVALAHAKKNTALGLEFYTEKRFVALTGLNMIGTAAIDHTAQIAALTASHFPPKAGDSGREWTTEAVSEWDGSDDDDELIKKALASKSASAVFSGRASFEALWAGDTDALCTAYPDPERGYDGSSADMALAQHLAFWTGKNCERILRLMRLSGLVRDKWDSHESYLEITITNAVAMQTTVYSLPKTDHSIADHYGACKLRGSEAQKKFGDNVRSQKLAECQGVEETILRLCKIPTAKFWIDAKDKTIEEILASITAIDKADDPFGDAVAGPTVVAGYQYLGATQQMEYFKGCVYIQESHKIFTPSGVLLKQDQFNATYGGYCFQLDDGGEKTTRKAWDAFTESQIIRYPKAQGSVFRPDLPAGEFVMEGNKALVNTYVPIDTRRMAGDVTPFLTHLSKVLPDANDSAIILAYMAACIQHKGVKFQWAPLIQGAEGNGKTLFTRCVMYAVGHAYTHLPPADQIAEKYNDWLFNKLFIGVEDVYVPAHKQEVIEVLKPMITNDYLSMRAMQAGQVMHLQCANFMLNSNHRDGIRKTSNDRRFSVFFSAQQHVDDLKRDGLDGEYFTDLYNWLKKDGYAIVNEFLSTYAIPDALNPATSCHRAPKTSTTDEAVYASLGTVEQEILEAIDEGRIGFGGGWVSSVAIERLLEGIRMTRAIPHNKRRALLQSLGYDYHPSLKEGRTNNPLTIDNNKKPRLYIRNGHISTGLTKPSTVVEAYLKAQNPVTAAGEAGEVFAKK